MPHNKNTDKVVKRILYWLSGLGLIGLLSYMLIPDLLKPDVSSQYITQQNVDAYYNNSNSVTLENDPFYEEIMAIMGNLRHDIPFKSETEKEITNTDEYLSESMQTIPMRPYIGHPSDNDEAISSAPVTLAKAPDTSPKSKQTMQATVTDSENEQVNDKTSTPSSSDSSAQTFTQNTSTRPQIALSQNTNTITEDNQANAANNQSKTSTTDGNHSKDSDTQTDNNDTQQANEHDSDKTPTSSASKSGEFVKHLVVFEKHKNYWQFIKENEENHYLVQQLKPLRKHLSHSALTKVEILYTDYVKDGLSKPENSKIIAVRGIETNKTWIFFTHFEKDDIYYYDYDGNAPEPSMDRVPLNYTRITSPFNPNRRHPITGRIRPHDGVDLKAPYGSPVHSTGNGIVSFAGWQHGYGRLVIVKHPNGYETRYAHMSAIDVAVGDNIKRGTVVGKLGNSGISTGHHLHFEVRVEGVPQDPMTVSLPSFKPIGRDYLDIWHFRAEQYQVAMKELTRTGYTVR